LLATEKKKRGSTGCWWPYLLRFPKLWSRTFLHRTERSPSNHGHSTTYMKLVKFWRKCF